MGSGEIRELISFRFRDRLSAQIIAGLAVNTVQMSMNSCSRFTAQGAVRTRYGAHGIVRRSKKGGGAGRDINFWCVGERTWEISRA